MTNDERVIRLMGVLGLKNAQAWPGGVPSSQREWKFRADEHGRIFLLFKNPLTSRDESLRLIELLPATLADKFKIELYCALLDAGNVPQGRDPQPDTAMMMGVKAPASVLFAALEATLEVSLEAGEANDGK